MLRELNATAPAPIPDDAPFGFVPARWRGCLETAAANGGATPYRATGSRRWDPTWRQSTDWCARIVRYV